jgi:hypothetical protein
VAHLRAVAGTDPDSPDLAGLIGELIVKSPDFARLWERYDVHTAGYGLKTFRHPVVGTITLAHEVLQINGTSGQRATIYLAEPGTPDHDKVQLLDLADLDGIGPVPDTLVSEEARQEM